MDTLLGLIGGALVYMAKSWWDERADERKWKRARERAKEIVESDDNQTTDPKEALQQAVIEQQTARIYQEARKVRESMNPPMNGDRTVPPLNIDIEEIEDKER